MQFSISHYRLLQYSSAIKGSVTSSEYIDGLIKTTFLLQKPNLLHKIALPTENAHPGEIPINEKKLQEQKKIRTYIPPEKRDFYESILTWPTKVADIED